MNDDLNTPLAVAALFEAVSAANTRRRRGSRGRRAAPRAVDQCPSLAPLGLPLIAGTSHVIDEVSEKLVLERDAARAAKNWTDADRLRDELVLRGWIVEDGDSGTLIRRP